jgi:hypothetical protein
MIDVRDLKWEVLKQTENDMLCRWKKVQVSYYDMKFHFNVDWFHDDYIPNPKYFAEDMLHGQEAVLKEIGYRLAHIQKHEKKHQTLQ